MLYYLFDWLDEAYDLPGAGVFQYITFRAVMAAVTSLFISLVMGKRLIAYLRSRLIGETIRNLGPESHKKKAGTPTMGGLIIIAAIALPTLLWGKLHNAYVFLILLATLWMGLVGFIDDYIKVVKKNKSGLRGKFKIVGQVVLGTIVGAVMMFHPDFHTADPGFATTTNIPFLKDYLFDYSQLAFWETSPEGGLSAKLIYILIAIFIVTAVSNGVNITDGLDGLAAGTTGIVATFMGLLAYVSGNINFAEYLNIAFIPKSGELLVFAAALIGACIGFLWYNAHPAQVFMGDTGSLALGGALGVMALMIKVELLLPLICGIFFVESLSVILQVSWFKYTKRKYGAGRRIFRMAPLHHHYELGGLHESKIVTRFWIVTILLVIIAFATLKLR